MGFFDNISTPVEEIPAGYGLPNDTYVVTLTDVIEREQKSKQDEEVTETKVLLEFTVQEGELEGMKHTVWLTAPDENNPKTDKNGKPIWKTQASVLKSWLINIGVPEDEIGNFDAEEGKDGVIGNSGTLKLTPQKDYPQYQNASFKLDSDYVPSGPSDRTLETKGDAKVDLSKFA